VQLGELAKLVVRARKVGSMQDAFNFLAALTPLTTTGSLPKPVALSPVSASVPFESVCSLQPATQPVSFLLLEWPRACTAVAALL
jgi:hypothetical protein